MGLTTLLGIKKNRWEKSINKFSIRAKKKHPQYPWDKFTDIIKRFWQLSLSSLPERAFLFRLSHDLQENSKIVEIGSWVGESSCLLATGLKGAESKLYAIDNFIGNASELDAKDRYKKRMDKLKVNNTKEFFDKNIAHFGLESKVAPIVADSVLAAKDFCEKEKSIDLIFIDGDHSIDGTKKDINTWLPFLKDGGIMVFHDFSSNHGVPHAIWWAIKESYFSDLIGINGSTIAFRKS